MSRHIENTAYVDYFNVEGIGACKIMFMRDGMDIRYICHSSPVSKTRRSEERKFPSTVEVSKQSREEIVDTLMQFTGKDAKADWVEFRVQVDDWVDEIVEAGWCLPCLE